MKSIVRKTSVASVIALLNLFCAAIAATDSSILELMKAVEERNNAVEKSYAAAYKLMNDYHEQAKAVTGAFYYSEKRPPGERMPVSIGYKDDVTDKLTSPSYQFDLIEEDYGSVAVNPVAEPKLHYVYWVYPSNQELTDSNRAEAEGERNAAITSAQQNYTNATNETYVHGQKYREAGTTLSDDCPEYHKAYWEWFATSRKAAIESGTPPKKFGKGMSDFSFSFPEHPDRETRNAADLKEWTDAHTRKVARLQRELAKQTSSDVVGSDSSNLAADDQAKSQWNATVHQWFEDEKLKAAKDYLTKTKTQLEDLQTNLNSQDARKAAEKSAYFSNLESPGGFYPCGAAYSPAVIKWKYPTPTTLEQHIATLNQISQQVERLRTSMVSLGDLSRFSGGAGLESFGYMGQSWSECGLVTPENYRSKIISMRKALLTMDAVPWPMLGKQYSLTRFLPGDKLAAETSNLSLGESEGEPTVGILASAASAWSNNYLAPWTPYQPPTIRYGNHWSIATNPGPFSNTPEDGSNPPDWKCSDGVAFSCYSNSSGTNGLTLISRSSSGHQYALPAGNVSPPCDGSMMTSGFVTVAPDYLLDDDVKFKMIVSKVGGEISTTTDNKTFDQVIEIATKYKAAHRARLTRSYKDDGSFTRLGLPKTLKVSVEIHSSEYTNSLEMKSLVGSAAYLPGSQLPSTFGTSFGLGGDTTLFAKWDFSHVTDDTVGYGPVVVPNAGFVQNNGPDGVCSLELPLSVRDGAGPEPTLQIGLFEEFYGICYPCYTDIGSLGFSSGIFVKNGGELLTVKVANSPLTVTRLLTGSSVSDQETIDPDTIFYSGGDISRITDVEFQGGKLTIEWTNYTHIKCKYFLKSSSGYEEQPFRVYEVSVGGQAGQLCDSLMGEKYPDNYDKVTVARDGKPWASVQLEYQETHEGGSTYYDGKNCKVEYLEPGTTEGSSDVVATQVLDSDLSSEFKLNGGSFVPSKSETFSRTATNNWRLFFDANLAIQYGERFSVNEPRTAPDIVWGDDTIDENFFVFEEFPYAEIPRRIWSPVGGNSGDSSVYGHLRQVKNTSLDVIPFILHPKKTTLEGVGWNRDGEMTEFDETGFPTYRTYKVAEMAAGTRNTISGNDITTVTTVGEKELSVSTTTFTDKLSTVTQTAAGVETKVKYYQDGILPWAVRSVTSPFSNTEYAYTKVGNSGLKTVETVTAAGGQPVTVTETLTNDYGGFVSLTKKVNGIEVVSAVGSGHLAASFWRPKTIKITSGGVSRTHILDYHPDGSLKTHDFGNGRTDSFVWDVLGRIGKDSKLDGKDLKPTYNGLETKFELGGTDGIAVTSETDIYGTLEKYSNTAGAGVAITKTAQDKYTTNVTAEGGRGAPSEFQPDGLLKKIEGGLGAPGVRCDYSVGTVDGTNCLTVTRTVLKASGADSGIWTKDYYDGYGRIILHQDPHPTTAGGLVDTKYAYDFAARKVTITPPSPSKPITVSYDAGWQTATIGQGGNTATISSSVTGATVKNVIKSGLREISSSEVELSTGTVTSRTNGKNQITATPVDATKLHVSGPFGLSLDATYDKNGVASLGGRVRGKTLSASVQRDGFGNVTQLEGKPPGAGGTMTASFDKAHRLTGATATGKSLTLAYNYADGGEEVTGTASSANDSFVVAEGSQGQPRKLELGDKERLAISEDARDGLFKVGIAGGGEVQSFSQTFSPSGYPLEKIRSDGSKTTLTYQPNGEVATVRKSDGASNGGASYLFTLTNDLATGFPTGFSSAKSSLAVTPYADGSAASVTYNSTDIDDQTQTYSCQYPAYYDDKPLGEVFGGSLAGYKINRAYDPNTGETKRVELYKGSQLVHAVDYTPDAFGGVHQVTASGLAQFSAIYDRPDDYTRKITVGPVVATRSLTGDGSARLASVATKAGNNNYSATFSYQGQSRKGLTITSPGNPSSVWSYEFQNAAAFSGQLQKATLARGASAPVVFDYAHNTSGNRSSLNYVTNDFNQYSQVRALGARVFKVIGHAAPGAHVEIVVDGGAVETLTAAADGSFSKTLPVPSQMGAATRIPVTVTATVPGAGDSGTNAVARKENVVAVTLTPNDWATHYGPHGALDSDWRWSYKWDPEERLIGLETNADQSGSGAVPNLRLKFAYDDRGRRIRKTVEYLPSGGGAATRTVVTKFIYDDWRLLAEDVSDTQEGASLKTYTWGADAFDEVGGENVIGSLLAIHSQGQSYLPVYDGNGNVIALVDQSGKEIASWERGPFGETIYTSGNTALCPFGFATAYTDAETGLCDFGHRYYSPTTGRWLSREPLGELESFNLYAYCHNDPINHIDVLGLAERWLNDVNSMGDDWFSFWGAIGIRTANVATGLAKNAWNSSPTVNLVQVATGNTTGYQKQFEGGKQAYNGFVVSAKNLGATARLQERSMTESVLDAAANHVDAATKDPTKAANLAFDVTTTLTFGADAVISGFGPLSARATLSETGETLASFESEGPALKLPDYNGPPAAKTTTPTVDRVRQVAQQGYDYAVQNPRVPGLNRMQLGKDAEVQATRWMRRWAERSGVDLGPGGLQFQVRGAHSVPDVVFDPAKQIFDFKLTPKAVKSSQHSNFQSDFPGYGIEYIFGP